MSRKDDSTKFPSSGSRQQSPDSETPSKRESPRLRTMSQQSKSDTQQKISLATKNLRDELKTTRDQSRRLETAASSKKSSPSSPPSPLSPSSSSTPPWEQRSDRPKLHAGSRSISFAPTPPTFSSDGSSAAKRTTPPSEAASFIERASSHAVGNLQATIGMMLNDLGTLLSGVEAIAKKSQELVEAGIRRTTVRPGAHRHDSPMQF